jgi:hypothetical protein
MATPPIEVEQVPIAAVDPRPSELEDWQLLLAPHHDERPWDGMISNDNNTLKQERELAVLGYTRLRSSRPSPSDTTRSAQPASSWPTSRTSPHDPGQTAGLATGGTHQRRRSPPSIRDDARESAKRASKEPIDLLREATPSSDELARSPLD